MIAQQVAVFDADGHVREDESIFRYFPEPYYGKQDPYPLFPSLDGFPRPIGSADLDTWKRTLERINAVRAVLYPTAGLAHGLIQDLDYAVAVARAYNDWLDDTYLTKDLRLLGAALLPAQRPEAAAAEIRRCAARPGFVVGMLPAVLRPQQSYGAKEFWPIFEAAQATGMPIAVHGGPMVGLGFDHFRSMRVGSGLSHPLAIFIQMADMVLSGVFEEFPELRCGYLEAGCGWVPWIMDRLDSKADGRLPKKPSDYIKDSPGFWFTFEIDEAASLRDCINRIGADRLMYPSDFPHGNNEFTFADELDEFIKDAAFDDDVKSRLLLGNARAFYGVDV
jgi:hypothetical protein